MRGAGTNLLQSTKAGKGMRRGCAHSVHREDLLPRAGVPSLLRKGADWSRRVQPQSAHLGQPARSEFTRMRAFCAGALFGLTLLGTPAASDGFTLNKCAERESSGWSFYCDPEPEEEEMVEEVSVPLPPAAPEPDPEPTIQTATEQMMAFRAYVDEAKYRAVLDPTEENVRAYIAIQKQMIDQAGHFTDQWQRVIFGSPELSVTDDFPMSAAGIGVYQDQMKAVRDETFRQVATTSGIIFIFEDDAGCGLCRAQGEVLAQMQDWYDVSVLAVSRDGGSNAAFPNAVVDEGQLAEFGLQDYPAPTMALVTPETGEIAVMGTGLLTADEVLARTYVLTQVPVGGRYTAGGSQ